MKFFISSKKYFHTFIMRMKNAEHVKKVTAFFSSKQITWISNSVQLKWFIASSLLYLCKVLCTFVLKFHVKLIVNVYYEQFSPSKLLNLIKSVDFLLFFTLGLNFFYLFSHLFSFVAPLWFMCQFILLCSLKEVLFKVNTYLKNGIYILTYL